MFIYHVIKCRPKSVPTPCVYICVCVCGISVCVCVHAHHQTLYKCISDDCKVSHQKNVWIKNKFGQKNYGQQKFLGQQRFLIKKKLWWKKFCGWIILVSKKFWNKIFVGKIFVSKKSLILKMFAPKNRWWVSNPILVIDLGPCPTLGRSISFTCSQLQCAAQEETMSISAFLCLSVCSLIFTLELSKQDVSPVFHKYFTSVSPVSHQCFTSF